ncbi:MAG: Ppx/GppA family phosphatase [Clostridia bacterium]|nr:Ppx/GppA family phosphatase [Clostridia bacterium]
MQKLAIIDLGSNSVRMSLFEINTDLTFRQTAAYRSMIKLSEGMTEDMCLKSEAQLRAIKALIEYKNILAQKGITSVRAVATAAVRKAKNGKQFLSSVKELTGIIVEIIDGETEARLDCLAVSHTLSIKDAVICDIGGGSTEFIAFKNGEMLSPAISIPMGSRSLFETFFWEGETPDAIRQATTFVKEQLESIPWLLKMQNAPIAGIGGTLRALAKYHLADESSNPIKNHEIQAPEIDALFDTIKTTPTVQRSTFAGIGKERCDIILAGLLPLMELKSLTNSPRLIVSDVGVREGLLLDFLASRQTSE